MPNAKPTTQNEHISPILKECLQKATLANEQQDYLTSLRWYDKAVFFEPENIQHYINRAESFCRIFDIKSAICNLRRASQLKGGEKMEFRYRLADLLDCYAMLCLESGEPKVALAYADEAISHCNIRPDYLVHRAICQVHIGRFELALDDVENALSLGSTSVDTIVLKAKLCYQLGDADTGDRTMKDAAVIDKTHRDVVEFEKKLHQVNKEIYDQAVRYILANDYVAARDSLKEALKENSNLDLRSRLLLGSTYRALGEYRDALANLADSTDWYLDQRKWEQQQKIRLAKAQKLKVPQQGTELGNQYGDDNVDDELEAKDVDGDNLVFRDHPDIVRQRCLVFNDMAMQEFSGGNVSSAVLLLNRAISAIKAQEGELKINHKGKILDVFDSKNGESQVEGKPAQLVTCTPQQLRAMYINRGDCYRELEKYRLALADYHLAYDMNDKEGQIRTRLSIIHNIFGIQFFNTRRFEEAKDEFERAITLNSTVAEYHYNLGMYYSETGKSEEACNCFERTLQLDPNHAQAAAKKSKFNFH